MRDGLTVQRAPTLLPRSGGEGRSLSESDGERGGGSGVSDSKEEPPPPTPPHRFARGGETRGRAENTEREPQADLT